MKKERQIFLHVGLPKTGTSWLQQILFPKLNVHLIRRRKDFITIPINGKIIISLEALSGSYKYSVDYRNYLANGMKAVYPDAKIIVGLREKNSWLKSMYNQGVKRGVFKETFDEWNNSIDPRILDFDNYVNKLNELFDDVFVYWFEDFKKDKKKVIVDMCNFLDVDVPVYEDSMINPSYYGFYERFFLFNNRILSRLRLSIITFFKFLKGVKKILRRKLD
ncbi:MAG: sulfotransferase [Promethearchaeota archaeon]